MAYTACRYCAHMSMLSMSFLVLPCCVSHEVLQWCLDRLIFTIELKGNGDGWPIGMMQVGAADDVEMQSMLPADISSQAKRKSSVRDCEQRPSIKSQGPSERSCGCKVAVYCAAAVMLLWAAFPTASTRIWHRAASSAHTAVPASTTADAPFSGSHNPGDHNFGKDNDGDNSTGSQAASPGASQTATPPAAVLPKDPDGSQSGADHNPGMPGGSPAAAPEDAQAGASRSGDPWCPLQYPQMSLKELETRRCYLFGGQPVRFTTFGLYLSVNVDNTFSQQRWVFTSYCMEDCMAMGFLRATAWKIVWRSVDQGCSEVGCVESR